MGQECVCPPLDSAVQSVCGFIGKYCTNTQTGEPNKQGSNMDLQVQATGTKVIQVTNIAPQATRDQMHTLFSFLGKIEDLRLYPSLRDASVTIQSRCCFLKFLDEGVLPISLHMTNTVFIDRAIIVQPFMSNDIPDELSGLEFANQASRNITGENRNEE